MLAFTRKVNEVIQLGGNVTITVVQCLGNKVKIGIDAPREIPVHRGEVFDRIIEDGGKVPDLVIVDGRQ